MSDGTTTRQIKNAPKDAVFVWVKGQDSYIRNLARDLGREDIKIVGPSFLLGGGNNIMGCGRHIVVDHAFWYLNNSHRVGTMQGRIERLLEINKQRMEEKV